MCSPSAIPEILRNEVLPFLVNGLLSSECPCCSGFLNGRPSVQPFEILLVVAPALKEGGVFKTFPKKKKRKKAKWMFGKKGSDRQRRKGKIVPSNEEFQRIARRDKNTFLSEQRKEIEENNRMGKTRELLKKTGVIKEMFQARMGMIKDEMVRT